MASTSAADLRAALRAVAHVLNTVGSAPDDWRQLSEHQHIRAALVAADKALVGAAGVDNLAEAAARLLFALERREHYYKRYAASG